MNHNEQKSINQQIKISDWSRAKKAYIDKKLYLLDDDLDITEVALALNDDHRSQVEIWIQNGLMYPPTKKEVKIFESHKDIKFKFCFINPYLIMQRTYSK